MSLHLLAEADDPRALARGVQGLSVRVARAVNRHVQRKGRLFADRYHARVLKTPRTMRLALRYVLLNARKHERAAVPAGFVDARSSAPRFDGFARPAALTFGARTPVDSRNERARPLAKPCVTSMCPLRALPVRQRKPGTRRCAALRCGADSGTHRSHHQDSMPAVE